MRELVRKMGANFSTFSPLPSGKPGKEHQHRQPMIGSVHPASGNMSSHTRALISQHLSLINGSALKKLLSNSARKSSRNLIKLEAPEPAQRTIHPKVEEPFQQTAPKKRVVQASSTELLRCLGLFLHDRFQNVASEFTPYDPVIWLRGLDRDLIAHGWQNMGFINPANIVFLYMLLRDLPIHQVKTLRHLQAQVLTALFLSYSYMGHEISYPVRLFLFADDSKEDFWKRSLQLIDLHSENMLRINSDSSFFAKIFVELKGFGDMKSFFC